MGKINSCTLGIVMTFLIFLFCSCSHDYMTEESVQTNVEEVEDSIKGADAFKMASFPIIKKLAEKSFNYNTFETRAMEADNDTLNSLISQLSKETALFLKINDFNTDSILSEKGKPVMAYIGLLILDYQQQIDNQEGLTRASIGDCVLRAAGLGDLVKRGLNGVKKRAILRILIKAGMKRAVPCLGWGLAIGEGAACLAGY